jgi:hypothetical protein
MPGIETLCVRQLQGTIEGVDSAADDTAADEGVDGRVGMSRPPHAAVVTRHASAARICRSRSSYAH